MKRWVIFIAILAVSAPAFAQLGGIGRRVEQMQQRKQQFDDIEYHAKRKRSSSAADVSAKIRQRFGVVQDAAVHKYVALVGTMLTEQTTRPKLPWTFIVLDTDGVNAFAAPGGFIHITRGALALIKSEAELAGVLGHEIAHVAQKHTVNAIQKSKAVQMGTSEAASSRGTFLAALTNRAYDMVLENSFDRGDELDADKEGILLVQKAGYAGHGAVRVPGAAGRTQQRAGGEEWPLCLAPGDAGAHRQGQAACGIEAGRDRRGPLHLDHQISADAADQCRDRRRRFCGS